MNIPTLNSADEVIAALNERGACWGRVPSTEAYHAWKPLIEQELGAAVVSKSALHEFAVSPYRFKWGKRKESDGMRFGQLVDGLALTPEGFASEFYVLSEKIDRRTKAGKEAWAAVEAEAAGRTLVQPEEYAQAERCAILAEAALDEYGLRMGENATAQVAMFVFMAEIFGEALPCPLVVTGCLDILPHEGETLWDLKTTREDVESEGRLSRVCEDFAYGVQAALYRDLFYVCTGERREVFRFLFVSTMTKDDEQPAVQCRVVSMENGTLLHYAQYYTRLLREYAAAYDSGEWGSEHLPEVVFVPSKWELEKIYR